MRLWHKDLIQVLPRQQLLGQWRECCLIAKQITEKGTPNHMLVNPIIDYQETEFIRYCLLVYSELIKRGYKADFKKFVSCFADKDKTMAQIEGCAYFWNNSIPIFPGWHNDRYLRQCLYNLQEKYDRGAIPDGEWQKIAEAFRFDI